MNHCKTLTLHAVGSYSQNSYSIRNSLWVEVTIPKAWHNCQAFQALFLGSRRMDISEVLLDSLTGRLFICLKLASGTSYTKTPKMYAKKTHMIIYVYIYTYKQWFPAILLLRQAVRMKGVTITFQSPFLYAPAPQRRSELPSSFCRVFCKILAWPCLLAWVNIIKWK